MMLSVCIWTMLVLVLVPTTSGDECHPHCQCKHKDDGVFVTCTGNKLQQVPQSISQNTIKLYFSGTAIRRVYQTDLKPYRNVTELFFRDTASDSCDLEYLAPGVFDGFDSLIALGIIGCGRLVSVSAGVFREFRSLETLTLIFLDSSTPSMTGNRNPFNNLRLLHIYRSGLKQVPDFSEFRTLNPSTDGFMEEVDLHNNMIEEIRVGAFRGVKVNILKLDQNRISTIRAGTFQNATILNLKLNRNKKLSVIQPGGFEGADITGSLDLSDTMITSLPTKGLNKITQLVLRNTPSLRKFPSVLELPKITIAELYYPHHCCAFANPEKQDPEAWKRKLRKAQEQINEDCGTTIVPSTQSVKEFAERHKRQTDLEHSHMFVNGSSSVPFYSDDDVGYRFGILTDNATKRPLIDDSYLNASVEVESILNKSCGKIHVSDKNITCSPEPDAFNPCEDVMGYVWLRVTIWFVLLAAILGNSLVLLVLTTSRSKFGVPKFLMCNLAFADFTMGVYLILIASIDVHTLGEYFTYAVQWQNGGGCQAAGFLSVFSSELSVFTLTILTLERWYAISHAIHLNKRLKFRHSVLLMVFGFIFAATLATLPLVGVSGYGNVSICLPMKAKNNIDVGYVVSLLLMNGLMFLAICFCYISMYWKVKGNANSARNNDAKIAKRMAILVFTNFACWAPIAFFGLTASAGMPLIDITNSKILFVFFYPLNSCANPFLYAILTKQFRKDVFILLGKYGICVDRANRYRGTHTSRTMSQSRGHKDVMLHGVHRRTESLFSRLSTLPDSNNGSRGSVTTPPKVYPATDKTKKYTIMEKASEEGQCIFTEEHNEKIEENLKSEGKAASSVCDHPPYIRSVSDYIGYKLDTCNKRYLRTRNSTETTSTYMSSGTDSAMDGLSEVYTTNDDVWKLREQDNNMDNQEDQYKIRPFTCLIYPENDEIRISHNSCFAMPNGSDMEEEEPLLPRYIREDIVNSASLKFDQNHDYHPKRSPTKSNCTTRPRFSTDPSLVRLDENVETLLLQTESRSDDLVTTTNNEPDMSFLQSATRISKHTESWF